MCDYFVSDLRPIILIKKIGINTVLNVIIHNEISISITTFIFNFDLQSRQI